MVKDAYILAKSESLQWANFIQNILTNAGFPQVWVQPSSVVPNEFIAELEQHLTDQYTQTWQGELRNTSGKLQTYKLIKEDFKREGYLTLPPYSHKIKNQLTPRGGKKFCTEDLAAFG